MAYNLGITELPFKGGKNILASEHLQFIEGGATLTGGVAYELGEAIARDKATGKWVKFVDANVANYDDFGILNIDVENVARDTVVGEVITRGSVYDAKLPASVTSTFKGKTPLIRYVKNV